MRAGARHRHRAVLGVSCRWRVPAGSMPIRGGSTVAVVAAMPSGAAAVVLLLPCTPAAMPHTQLLRPP